MNPQFCTLTLVALMLSAGCSAPAASDDGIDIPRPSLGDVVSYHGNLLDVTIVHRGIAEVQGSHGQSLRSIALRFDLHHPTSGETAGYHQFVDEDGMRAVIAAPCRFLGIGFGAANTCQDGDAMSASFLEERLPGGMGAAPLWGSHLSAGKLKVLASFEGEAGTIEFDVVIRDLGNARCATLALLTTGATEWLSGDSSYPGAVPRRMTLCEGEAWPREVDYRIEGIFTRTSLAQGDDIVRAAGEGGDAHAGLPASNARRVAGYPPGPTQDPVGLTHEEAYRFWLSKDPELAGFAREARLTLLSSLGFVSGQGEAFLLDMQDIQRSMRVVAADGRARSGSVTKTCINDVCDLSLGETAWDSGRPPASPELAAVPLGDLARVARNGLGGTPSMERILLHLPGQERGLGAGDRWYVYYYAAGESMMGSNEMLLDARTGMIRSVSAGSEFVESLTGTRIEALRSDGPWPGQ